MSAASLPRKADVMMMIGKTDVNSWAAIVMARSKIWTRVRSAAVRRITRPGQCSSSQAMSLVTQRRELGDHPELLLGEVLRRDAGSLQPRVDALDHVLRGRFRGHVRRSPPPAPAGPPPAPAGVNHERGRRRPRTRHATGVVSRYGRPAVPHHLRALPHPLRRAAADDHAGAPAGGRARGGVQPVPGARPGRAHRPAHRLRHRRDEPRPVGGAAARRRVVRRVPVVLPVP